MSKPYRKKFLALAEAAALVRCDIDLLMEAIAEGTLKGFVIATEWPLATDGERPLSGYVELPPEALIQARVKQLVIVEEGKLLSGQPVRLASPQKVPVGIVHLLGEEVDQFRVAWWGAQRIEEPTPKPAIAEPGPRATLNLERTVGALAQFIAENVAGGRYKHGGAPNAKQIAEAVATLLERVGLADSGLSARAIELRITNGVKALKDAAN